nr:unnamed protein product [Digitaria exilis]
MRDGPLAGEPPPAHEGLVPAGCLSSTTVLLIGFIRAALTPASSLSRWSSHCALLRHRCTSLRMPLWPFLLSACHSEMAAWPLRLPMMVASRDDRYSTLVESTAACSRRVITTPHGTGHPRNLWPETLTLPMGFWNVTLGRHEATQRAVAVDVEPAAETTTFQRRYDAVEIVDCSLHQSSTATSMGLECTP